MKRPHSRQFKRFIERHFLHTPHCSNPKGRVHLVNLKDAGRDEMVAAYAAYLFYHSKASRCQHNDHAPCSFPRFLSKAMEFGFKRNKVFPEYSPRKYKETWVNANRDKWNGYARKHYQKVKEMRLDNG
jgi:hypothetical protein